MGIFDTTKDIANVLKEAGKIDEYRKILDLQEKMLEMQNKIQKQDEEIKILQEKLKTKDDLVFREGAYYIKSTDEGPFCQACWDDKKKLIRIVKLPSYATSYQCKVCKNIFSIKGGSNHSDLAKIIMPEPERYN